MKNTLYYAAGALVVAGFVGFFVLPGPDPEVPRRSGDDNVGAAPGKPVVQVVPPENLSANAQLGKSFYEAKCAECHGENAAGQDGVAPPLVHKIYEPSHHGDMAFVLAAKNGVRSHHWKFGNMPAVEGLTDGDVKLITRYVRELQQVNGIN